MMCKAEDTPCLATGCRISVLERPKAYLLMIRWSDARRCHYGEQIWRLRKASRDGRCALSGSQIRRGDWVFKPSTHPPPLNAAEMILQSAVPESVGTDQEPSTEQSSLTTSDYPLDRRAR